MYALTVKMITVHVIVTYLVWFASLVWVVAWAELLHSNCYAYHFERWVLMSPCDKLMSSAGQDLCTSFPLGWL